MDFNLTEEQRAFQASALAFAQGELAAHAGEWDARGEFPLAALRALGGLGFAGLFVPKRLGGLGLARLDGVLVFEALAQGCPSTAAFLSIHNMATWMVSEAAGGELAARLLPALGAMEKVASYCLTEPGAGSDAASLVTQAKQDGDFYVVNGVKSFISGAGVSDVYVVMLRTGADGAGGISCLVIEKGTEGLRFGKAEDKMGWRNQPTAEVIFEDCRVPVANLLGREGDGFKLAMRGLDGGRLNIAACSLGGATWALDKARGYAKERAQFGKTLSEFQSVQFKLADMATELAAARLLLYQAASSLDARESGATARVAMAKRYATDIAFDVVNQALQIHGGYGYLRAHGIERVLRDLRVHQILEGTNEIMRVLIARAVLSDE